MIGRLLVLGGLAGVAWALSEHETDLMVMGARLTAIERGEAHVVPDAKVAELEADLRSMRSKVALIHESLATFRPPAA